MASVFEPGGPLQQLGNLMFLLAALVSDVLLIRLFLVLAYCFLVTAAALGMPKWPFVDPTGWLSVDTLVWGSLALLFHGIALCRLLWDEHSVALASEDEEQLWRFFRRRGGMGRLEFKQVLRRGSWRCVPAGAPVLQRGEARLLFCVLVEGRVAFQTFVDGETGSPPTLMHSGSCFDIALLNVFGVFIGLEKDESSTVAAVAADDCLLYCWSLEELNEMATQLAPAVGAFWRNFAMCQLGLKLTWTKRSLEQRLCATGQLESKVVLKGGRSRDFTDPLREYEQHAASASGVLRWLVRSFHPFPPRGLRHTALPVTGILARNRLIALKTAQARALMEAESGDSGSEGEGEPPEERSHRGGTAAYELLAGLPNLATIRAMRAEELVQHVCPHQGKACAALAPNGGGGGGRQGPGSGGGRVELSGRGGGYDRSFSMPSSPVTKHLSDVV